MASINKRGEKWQALVARNGTRKSATFDTKKQAEAWAASQEAELLATKRGEIPPGVTFGQLLERYRDEVVPEKEGEKWETTRIEAFLRDEPALVKVLLTDLDSTHVIAWRDRRKKQVQGSTINREWTILSHACTVGKRDWKWLRHNPFKEATRPKDNPPRTRTPTEGEIERILFTLRCDPQVTPVTKNARVGFAWLFALETGMREGEIAALLWSDIKDKEAHLRKTKNGDERDVPLTTEARRLLTLLPRPGDGSDGPAFQLSASQIESLYRKAKNKAAVEDLHFHDSRRAALSKLAKKVDVLTLAKISGHRDLSILLNTYYKTDMSQVADAIG